MRALLLMCAAATLAAQPADRSKPPATTPVRAWKLPSVFEATLPNGLGVVLVEDNRVPLVTMRLVFPCGSRRDPRDLPGAASALAEMLLKGTASRTGSEIVEGIDRIGASLSAAAGADEIAMNGNAVSESLPDFLDVVSDVARNATIPELELTVYRQSRRQALARQRAQPGYIASEVFRGAVFGEHPYAHLGPTAASLDRLSPKALSDYRDRYLIPNNACLILVGKLPAHAQVMKVIGDRFGAWQRKALAEAADPAPPAPKRRLILVDTPGASQAAIQIGRLAASQRDADFYPMIVSAALLGRRLAPDARLEPLSFDEASALFLSLQARNEAVGEALQSTLDHMRRLAGDTAAGEWTDAGNAAAGSYLLRIESQAGLADSIAKLKVMHLPLDRIESYTSLIDAVTPEQAQQAAKKHLTPDEDTVVVVGDASRIQQQLRKIGEFEIVRLR